MFPEMPVNNQRKNKEEEVKKSYNKQ